MEKIESLKKVHQQAITMAKEIVDKSFSKKDKGDRMGAVMTVYNNIMSQFRTQAGFKTMKEAIDGSAAAMIKKMQGS